MNQNGSVHLESYRLAQYSQQYYCYLCDGANSFDSELCRHCFAPMALTRQALKPKQRPQLISTIGCSGVGKTVYLGMLMDLLSRQSTSLQAAPRGAFSVSLQQTTMAALAECRFPEKTPTEPDRWSWMHCAVRPSERRREREVVLADTAGEAIAEEVDHPDSYPVIRRMVSKCSGLLLLVDGQRLGEGRHDQEHFAIKVLTFLSELERPDKRSWHRLPIALVLTKADQVEESFDDPEQFVERHAPGVAKFCGSAFREVKCFAAGVAGACAYRVSGDGRQRVPLRVEPRGIVEPFAWLLDRLLARK